jgi:GrpB-like predicted nucleotidyltransferase (UPF0157 family)
MKKTLKERIADVSHEEISIVPYDPEWPRRFEEEAEHLRRILPQGLIVRIEHFGSTAVPGLCAKPIVDMLVEVRSLKETRDVVAPLLESEGYDYFWRPEPPDGPAMYAWFIKRNAQGRRTHHIHMVEASSRLWDGLYFRDYLRKHVDACRDYGALKVSLSKKFRNDRESYTKSKTDFVLAATEKAKLLAGQIKEDATPHRSASVSAARRP